MNQFDPNELEQSLLDTVRTSQFTELPADIFDAFTGLPIASTLTKIYQGVLSVKDYLFRKKVVRFVTSLSTISPEERQQKLDELLCDTKDRQRFSEQLLISLEQLDDERKASIMGHLSVGLIKGEVSLLEYWRMNRSVKAISLDEEWPILMVIEKYKKNFYENNRRKDSNWNFEGVLLEMVNQELSLNMSDGDLRSIVIRINQTGLFGCLGWRRGPAHDCEIAPWYFKLKQYMNWEIDVLSEN